MPSDNNTQSQSGIPNKSRALDLVFVFDMTASQGKYGQTFRNRCKDVCYALEKSGLLDGNRGLHLAVVAFRDQDQNRSYITRDGFTGDINATISSLDNLQGVTPTGLTAALDSTLKLQWRRNAAKMAVVITDTGPPQGAGQTDYGISDPHGNNVLMSVRAMEKRGIAMLFVTSQLAFSNYFKYTSGLMLPLTNSDILAPLIVGLVAEQISSRSRPPEHEPPQQGKDTERAAPRPWGPHTPLPTNAPLSDASDLPPPSFSIILQNSSNESIEFSYIENDIPISGTLAPKQRGPNPTTFLALTPYLFNLKKGRRVESLSITFEDVDNWDLAAVFN